jgi:hypothetical protein
MAPPIVMLAAWLVARSVGNTGLWLQADSWTGALRIALAAMFVFTAVSHFHPRTRPDLIRMVPWQNFLNGETGRSNSISGPTSNRTAGPLTIGMSL